MQTQRECGTAFSRRLAIQFSKTEPLPSTENPLSSRALTDAESRGQPVASRRAAYLPEPPRSVQESLETPLEASYGARGTLLTSLPLSRQPLRRLSSTSVLTRGSLLSPRRVPVKWRRRLSHQLLAPAQGMNYLPVSQNSSIFGRKTIPPLPQGVWPRHSPLIQPSGHRGDAPAASLRPNGRIRVWRSASASPLVDHDGVEA